MPGIKKPFNWHLEKDYVTHIWPKKFKTREKVLKLIFNLGTINNNLVISSMKKTQVRFV